MKPTIAIGSSSTVSQTASIFPSCSALFLLGASSMNTILRSSPSAAAADPGWVVSPPLPTTSARCPGHCDSATVTSRRPGRAAAGGGAAAAAVTTAAAPTADGGGDGDCDGAAQQSSAQTARSTDPTA